MTGEEDFAGALLLGDTGAGTVFQNFYCYARPKHVVGILQNIPENYHPRPKVK